MGNNTPWNVRWTAGALEDTVEIIQYILKNDGVESARELSDLLKTDVKRQLTTFPYRGHVVPELYDTGQECKEIHIKAYRIIYQPAENGRMVWILLVAHGKRNILDMLLKRMLHYL